MPQPQFRTQFRTPGAGAPSRRHRCTFKVTSTGAVAVSQAVTRTRRHPLISAPSFFPPVADSTPWTKAATRSALQLPRTSASLDGSPPSGASNSNHVSPTARSHQSLVQAGKRPVVDPLREQQPRPQVPDVIGAHIQAQPHFVPRKVMAVQPDLSHRLPFLIHSSAVLQLSQNRTSARLPEVRMGSITLPGVEQPYALDN